MGLRADLNVFRKRGLLLKDFRWNSKNFVKTNIREYFAERCRFGIDGQSTRNVIRPNFDSNNIQFVNNFLTIVTRNQREKEREEKEM